MPGPVVTHIVRRNPSSRGVIFFVFFVLIFYSLAVVATVFMAPDLLFKTPTPFHHSLMVMVAAFLAGWVFTLVKAVIAAAVAVQFRRIEADKRKITQPMGV